LPIPHRIRLKWHSYSTRWFRNSRYRQVKTDD
jgi:hypothetical protein